MSPTDLPDVAGRACEVSIARLEHQALGCLRTEQDKPCPDNALLAVLCNTVRLCREYVDFAQMKQGEP